MPLMSRKNRLREARKAGGFSGYDLQLITSVRAHKIYLIERGLARASSYERFALAQALDSPIDVLFPPEMERTTEVVSCSSVN